MGIDITADNFTKELLDIKRALELGGITNALEYLNKRTPHRYTGIFKYDNDILENIAIYDKYDPTLKKGEDVPLAATYCSLLISQDNLEIIDAEDDHRVKGKIITPVISYCGVAIVDADGKPFGSLCHYDMNRCQQRVTDIPLLQAASQMLYEYLYPKSA